MSVQAVLDRDGRMKFECPTCGKILKLPIGPGGKVKCPRTSCGTRFEMLPADLIPASPLAFTPEVSGSASAAAMSSQEEPFTRQRELSPPEQIRAKSRAVEPTAHDGLFVCGSGSAPDVLLLTPTHLMLGRVQVAHFSQLRQQLRNGSFDSSLMPHPSWSVALKDLKWVETRAGDRRRGYVEFCSNEQTGQQEKLVVFDKKPEGASFLNQLRAQLGDGWQERLCRDWQLFRMDLGAGLFLSAFVTLLCIIALIAASGEGDWETEQRVGILKLIIVAILWVIGTLLGPIGVILLWLAIVGYLFYSLIYSSWRSTLNLLRLAPRKS